MQNLRADRAQAHPVRFSCEASERRSTVRSWLAAGGAQGGDGCCQLALLKPANRGDAPGSGRDAGGGVLRRDAADGEHGDSHCPGGLRQPVEALRGAVGELRGGGEDGPEEKVVGAVTFGGAGFLRRMTRSAHQKFRGRVLVTPATHRRHRQSPASQVHSAGPGGQSDIEPVVHQNSRRCASANALGRKMEKRAAGEVRLANLNPIDAGSGGAGSRFEHGRLGGGPGGGIERPALGDVAENGTIGG